MGGCDHSEGFMGERDHPGGMVGRHDDPEGIVGLTVHQQACSPRRIFIQNLYKLLCIN